MRHWSGVWPISHVAGKRAASDTAQPFGAQRSACAPIHFSLRSRTMFFPWRKWPQWKFRLDRRPGSARRAGRSTRAVLSHTARPRLVQLEDRDLTGNMLALEAALVDARQGADEPPALVAPAKPGFSEQPGFWERASDSDFAVDYNISTVESAAWKLDAADAAV